MPKQTSLLIYWLFLFTVNTNTKTVVVFNDVFPIFCLFQYPFVCGLNLRHCRSLLNFRLCMIGDSVS